jgi:hypothetical protein
MIQMAKVLRYESGPHAELAGRISRELDAAVRCLLDPIDKAAYDAGLFIAKSAAQTSAADSSVVAAAAAPQAEQPASEKCEESAASSEAAVDDDVSAAAIEEDSPPLESSASGASYNFAADLKLDEEEEVDDFSSDLNLPEPAPAPQPAPLAAAPSPAASRPAPLPIEQEPELRPSFLDMLEQPAKGKDSSKSKKGAAPEKEKKAAVYDPPPLPSKSRLPTLPHLPPLSVKQGAILAAVAAVVLAVWLVPKFYHPGPNPGRILGMLEASDPQTRIVGIDSLQGLEMDPKETSARLVKILKEDQVDEVRLAAVSALVNSGVTAELASGELKPLLATEKHDSVKQLLQWLIEQSGGK